MLVGGGVVDVVGDTKRLEKIAKKKKSPVVARPKENYFVLKEKQRILKSSNNVRIRL